MASVKVDLPNMPKYSDLNEDQIANGDGVVQIDYLGTFKNGETTDVDDAVVAVWSVNTGKDWPESGTLVIDHSEANEQRKNALDDLRKNDPEVYNALMADLARQKLLDTSGTAENNVVADVVVEAPVEIPQAETPAAGGTDSTPPAKADTNTEAAS